MRIPKDSLQYNQPWTRPASSLDDGLRPLAGVPVPSHPHRDSDVRSHRKGKDNSRPRPIPPDNGRPENPRSHRRGRGTHTRSRAR